METIRNNNTDYKNILDSFISKCNDNQIWVSLAGKTLLCALNEKKYYEMDDYLEVFMTFESFNQFKIKYEKNIIDSTNTLEYFYLNPFYIDENINKLIKINILIPANIKKTQKFYSIKNILRQKIGYWKSKKYDKFSFKKVWWNIMSKFLSPLLWEEVYVNIYDEIYEGYFVVDDFKTNINKNWIPSLTFLTKEVNFLNVNCPIIQEAELYLQKKFDFDWKNFSKIKSDKYDFLNMVKNYN